MYAVDGGHSFRGQDNVFDYLNGFKKTWKWN